jgi:hypothetical protein
VDDSRGCSDMADPEKAFLKPEQGSDIPCLFNPADLTMTKVVQWSPTKGKGKNTGKLRFQQGQPGTVALTLIFDTTADGSSVTKHTDALLSLTRVNKALKGSNDGNNSARPPWCEFHWGDFHSFKSVVENLQIKYTYFASDGTPLRAQATLTLKQFEDEDTTYAQNPTSGTPHPHAVHHVLPGETLDRIAANRYGDPSRWRAVARMNNVVDPLDLAAGTILVIPDDEAVSRA